MQKVDFGYNNDKIINSSFEGIGSFSENEKAYGPVSGLVVDVVNFNGEEFLVSKITSDYDDSEIGKYDVRKVAIKKYDDGSSEIYSSPYKDELTNFVSNIVNSPVFCGLMNNGALPSVILQGLNFEAFQSKEIGCFNNNTDDVPILVTAISEQNFNNVKNNVTENIINK